MLNDLEAVFDNAEKGINDFNAKMTALFPGYIAKALHGNLLGPCVLVEFANVPSVKDAPNGIIQNASIHIRLVLSLCDGHRRPLSVYEIDGASSIDRELKAAGASFRIIKAKTPAEALTKLYAWFAKHQAAIASVPQKLNAKP